jgi:hypothetical protein
MVDLKVGAVKGRGEQIKLEAEKSAALTPAIVRGSDCRLVVREARPSTRTTTPKASCARSRAQQLLWTFNTIPRQ